MSEKVTHQASRLPGGDGEHPETEIDHIDRSSFVEMPPMADRGR